jgi:hypothetical protein
MPSRRQKPDAQARSANAQTDQASTDPKSTKKAELIARLESEAGADIASLSAALGWQPHSTRAALTGLRKAGYTITRGPGDAAQPARYRITGRPA